MNSIGIITFINPLSKIRQTEDEIIRTEKLTKRTSTNTIHCARLQVYQYGTGHILATRGFIVVNVDTLKLKVRITMVRTSRINTMFVGNHFPELKISPNIIVKRI